MAHTAVLLMAYGSPDSLDDIGSYLMDIRGGRPTSPELIEEIRQRYARIGGRSPLLEITRAQAAALEIALNTSDAARQSGYRVYVGMRHWQPRIRSAVAHIAADGARRLIGLVMAPHQSHMSTGAYFQQLEAAVNEEAGHLELLRISSWHDSPGLIAALAENAALGMRAFDTPPYVLFTAHSLPVRILQQGDAYEDQLGQTAAWVAGRLGLPAERWQFCYQSAGQSQEPWLGPPVEQVVADLADSGQRNILAVPVGFTCDHVEILYDLDIVARGIAERHGSRFERSPSLNTSPTFIAALADLVTQYAYSL